jgi:hypothetical protein
MILLVVGDSARSRAAASQASNGHHGEPGDRIRQTTAVGRATATAVVAEEARKFSTADSPVA